MNEQLISFQTAKLAKEKGFNTWNDSYTVDGKIIPLRSQAIRTEKCIYPAPTQSLLQKWLREEHNLIITSDPITGFRHCEYSWNIYSFNNIWSLANFTAKTFISYEESLEAGLLEALKLIK